MHDLHGRNLRGSGNLWRRRALRRHLLLRDWRRWLHLCIVRDRGTIVQHFQLGQPTDVPLACILQGRHRAVRPPASLGRNLRHEQSVRQTPVVQFRNLSETHRLKLPGLKPFKTRRLTHKGESHRLCRWTRKGSAVPSCRSRRPTGVRGPLACDDGHTRQALL